MFSRALEVMAGLYASAMGTCVIQHSRVPPRPSALDGVVIVAFGGEEAAWPKVDDLRNAIQSGASGSSVVNAEEISLDKLGVARICCSTHEEAVALVGRDDMSEWLAAHGGWAMLGYNDRPYHSTPFPLPPRPRVVRCVVPRIE